MDHSPAGTDLRICVVGDDLVAGVGDPRALGWTGRVAARTEGPGRVTVFALGVPGEGTAALAERTAAETERRYSPVTDNRLVVGLGRGDLLAGTSLARSRLALANILDNARSRSVPCFVVGPPPSGDGARDEAVGELTAGFADVCARRSVPFVDCCAPLLTHEQWHADLGTDGLPGQAGYGLLAWLVLHGGWHPWLGLTPP